MKALIQNKFRITVLATYLNKLRTKKGTNVFWILTIITGGLAILLFLVEVLLPILGVQSISQ